MNNLEILISSHIEKGAFVKISKVLFICVAIFFIATLSCKESPTSQDRDENTDGQNVASDKSTLTIIYAVGDSAGSVTSDVGLPKSGPGGTIISWVTNKRDLITIKGVVSRPDSGCGDSIVELIATITKGTASDTLLFCLTVKEDRRIIGRVTDIDRNVYKMIRIGKQVWTLENLRTTTYNDGIKIPMITNNTEWGALTTPAYCYYGNTTNADSINKFGALYNWYAVNTTKIAPPVGIFLQKKNGIPCKIT